MRADVEFSAVKLPVAGEDAGIIVAVGVAEHDVLLGAAALHQPGNIGKRMKIRLDDSTHEDKDVTGSGLPSILGPFWNMESQRPNDVTFKAQGGFHPLRAQPHPAANLNRRLEQSPIAAQIDLVIKRQLCCYIPI